jgi:class 3 adenylate cyclase
VADITHDVYHLQRGRWVLAQQYREHEREVAITRAKELFGKGSADAVGVMRERFDAASGASHGTLIYCNTKIDSPPNLHGRVIRPESEHNAGRERGRSAAGNGRGRQRLSDGRRNGATATSGAPGAANVFGKFISLFTVAVVLAYGTWFLLSKFGLGQSLAGVFGERDLPLKVILAGFILYTLVIGPTMITKYDLQAIFYQPDDGDDDDARPERRASTRGLLGLGRKRSGPGGDRDTDADADGDTDEGEKEEAPPPKPAAKPLDKATANRVNQARETMVRFFELCLGFVSAAELPTKSGKLDNMMMFGCHLFFAGAAESLCQSRGLQRDVLGRVLEPCVVALGRKPEQAKKFAESYEEYLLEPSYHEVFRAGRDAMEAYVIDERVAQKSHEDDDEDDEVPAAPPPNRRDDENDADIGIFLLHALEDWASPAQRRQEKKKNPSGTMAVMFTYIVGLADITETHGEGVGRRVTGVHDTVVRGAIKDFDGWEVKHTGEGIMAAFNTPLDAAMAAVAMQRGFAEYNAGDADVALHVKIGVNAGEPIVEGDDIFGTTVQMAARLAQNAVADQILVSSVIRELAGGKDVRFARAGEKMFKGIAEPVPVFEAVWRDDTLDAAETAAS